MNLESLPNEDAEARLHHLMSVGDGDFGPDSISPKALIDTGKVHKMASCFPTGHTPRIYPTYDGGISFEWGMGLSDPSLEMTPDSASYHAFGKYHDIEKDFDLTSDAGFEEVSTFLAEQFAKYTANPLEKS